MPNSRDKGGLRGSFFARRFGTRQARFRSSMALGFVVATVGFVAGAPGARTLFADENIFSALFGRPAERTYDQGVTFAQTSDRPRRVSRRQVVRLAAQAPAQPGRQSLCVRACDGYAFPVGTYHGERDRPAHEAACQAECPDARTTLYVLPAGSDHIDDAVNVSTGQTYSELPDAFHYTNVLDGACTCHRSGTGSRTLSLLRDMTLRRGDAVMTAKGFRVFHGGARFPYRKTDFLALSKSRDVRQADRSTFSALERESLKASVKGASRAVPPASASIGATPEKPGA
jgi:hypothetical protein